eukprot:12182739-Prorocentrum_lima.AAC.1
MGRRSVPGKRQKGCILLSSLIARRRRNRSTRPLSRGTSQTTRLRTLLPIENGGGMSQVRPHTRLGRWTLDLVTGYDLGDDMAQQCALEQVL